MKGSSLIFCSLHQHPPFFKIQVDLCAALLGNSWPLWPSKKGDWALRKRTKLFMLPHPPCKKLADCSNMPSALCFELPIKKLSAHHCHRLLIFYLFIFSLSCCSSAPLLLSNLSWWWLCFRPLCALSRWRQGISTTAYWWPVAHMRLKPESILMHLYIKVTNRFYWATVHQRRLGRGSCLNTQPNCL